MYVQTCMYKHFHFVFGFNEFITINFLSFTLKFYTNLNVN